ncbi:MAG: hypothetical protein KAX53_02345 [Saprospiraceae bacterium]|nr:hypothetical protein [Saprospiraceae bacterium]MBP7210846.1 hypothetical protein [Paludibacteraceae bacterium]MBP8212555.1 hypothetical protein [Saprospiraceae bacterium]
MDDREKDVLKLCKAVLDMSPAVHYNGNGPDTSTCQLCYKHVNYPDADISEIQHSSECAYLIAKDLSTNLI